MSHFLSILPFFPCSSEVESDFYGDSLNAEVSEGQTLLLEPPTCWSPIRRWASLARSSAAPEESPKTSKVADGKQCPNPGMLQQTLLRTEVRVGGRGFEVEAVTCDVASLYPLTVSFLGWISAFWVL